MWLCSAQLVRYNIGVGIQTWEKRNEADTQTWEERNGADSQTWEKRNGADTQTWEKRNGAVTLFWVTRTGLDTWILETTFTINIQYPHFSPFCFPQNNFNYCFGDVEVTDHCC